MYIARLIDAAKRVTVRVMLDEHGYIGQKMTIQQVHDELTKLVLKSSGAPLNYQGTRISMRR